MATKQADDAEEEPPPGIAVDARGGGVVDPTKNVLDLVKAESKKRDELREADKELTDVRIKGLRDYEDGMREAGNKFSAYARDSIEKLQNWMRDSESKRLDQLADLRQIYETRVADMLRTSVESTSSLVSTQLVQIQNTFNERVSQLEKFRWESGGKTSVSDPALADALTRLGSGLTGMQTTFADTLAELTTSQAEVMAKMAMSISALKETETMTTGKQTGAHATWAMIGAIVLLALSVLGGIGTIVALAAR